MRKSDERDLATRWSGRLPLTARILAVNVFALAILAGSFFYLDSYRERIIAARMEQVAIEARMAAVAVSAAAPARRARLLGEMGAASGTRLRIYDRDGPGIGDSWEETAPTYSLRDPEAEPWDKDVARWLDRAVDAIVGADRPPPFVPRAGKTIADWPEVRAALANGEAATMLRLAAEGTPYMSAAAPIDGGKAALLVTINARDIRAGVRDERLTLGIILFATILVSVLLSLFLARTIARPLRRLATAAHRVRLGRAREVTVPQLPARRDEIGFLARALHDMTQALRYRIDATEAFAADVTHELKNPLASLRSAVDALDTVDDPSLRAQLLDVVRHDVIRLDRLVVDIAEVSRLDAELSRARFERVDLGQTIEPMVAMWEQRGAGRGVRIAFARPLAGSTIVMGEESRLARVIDNIVDNALSFSPAGALVEVAAARLDDEVVVTIEDEGRGVPEGSRQAIFNRFHSIRPEEEAFGRHSGLGLAIAKAIVEGHGGTIAVEDRPGGRAGARFVIRLPGASIE